jgi:hypothetical protein
MRKAHLGQGLYKRWLLRGFFIFFYVGLIKRLAKMGMRINYRIRDDPFYNPAWDDYALGTKSHLGSIFTKDYDILGTNICILTRFDLLFTD